MKKKLLLLLSFIFINTFVFAQPPGQKQDKDWPCIQVLIEELSWASIWTGPPLDEKTVKWKENEDLRLLATKIMSRKTKEKDGIIELKKFIKKNNSSKELTLLFHALFDTTNEVTLFEWKCISKLNKLEDEKLRIKMKQLSIVSRVLYYFWLFLRYVVKCN